MKKILALVVAMLLVASMVSALAVQTVNVGGGTGSITISNATVGETYGLYRLFEATLATAGFNSSNNTGINYKLIKSDLKATVDGTEVDGSQWFDTLTVEGVTYVTAKAGLADAIKTDNFKAWAKAYGTQVGTTTTASDTVITFSNIPLGYYLVESSLGAVVSVDSTTPNVTIIDKNQTVTFDKNIVEGTDLVKLNEAGLMEDVNFDITVNAKNYEGEDKVFKYVIKDTMDPGWTLNAAPVVTIASVQKTADTDYTITYKTSENGTEAAMASAQYFEIVINWTEDGTKDTAHKYNANDVIKVTYTAHLDPNKPFTYGTTPNDNKAKVDYFKGNDQPNSPSGHLAEVTTETFDTQLTIQKTDGTNALKGAEFKLTSTNGTTTTLVTGQRFVEHTGDGTGAYLLLTDGTYTTEQKTGDATHDAAYANDGKTYDLKNVAEVKGAATSNNMQAFVGENGQLTFTGLAVGEYTLTETVVPAGYNKAADITFTISFDARAKITEGGTEIDNPNYKKFASSNPNVILDSTNNVFNTTVVNNRGTELPSTGGIGTTIFYVAGSILVLAAVIFMVTKRRMNANND